jgi:signal transduction histidine kinase
MLTVWSAILLSPIRLESRKQILFFMILIGSIPLASFLTLANIAEDNIKTSLFEQNKNHQIHSAKSISGHISSDLSLAVFNLREIANSDSVQRGEFSSEQTKAVVEAKFQALEGILGGISILDENDTIVYTLSPDSPQKGVEFTGISLSSRDHVKQTRVTQMPVFSGGYSGMQDQYLIAVTHPIVSKQTGEYLGLVVAAVQADNFFKHYGNTYDVQKEHIQVLDRNMNIVVTPFAHLQGKNFFGEEMQRQIGYNQEINDHFLSVISGKPNTAVLRPPYGESINTGYPIIVDKVPVYSLFIATPTSAVYAQIDNVLFVNRLEQSLLITGIVAAILLLVVFLSKWNRNLTREVQKRTKELAQANEMLKVNDKMQKEFINIAAHELRTPIQPIISAAFLMLPDDSQGGGEEKEQSLQEYEDDEEKTVLVKTRHIHMIKRNAERMLRLSNIVLDITKLEGGALKLDMESLDLKELVLDASSDLLQTAKALNLRLALSVTPAHEPILINADRQRLTQVIFNLLDNAIKFSQPAGTIHITVERNENTGQATVTVKDAGKGIDPEIMPRLFTKFTSKTETGTGTGLGLYISKAVIEMHGGQMLAANNPDSAGASFSFSIPLRPPHKPAEETHAIGLAAASQ